MIGDVAIPQLGFGVFQIPPEETVEATLRAFETGYRHIDTAAAYQNEAEVGQAFRASGLDRDEVFVTTKCFNDSHGYEQARQAFQDSIDRLGSTGPCRRRTSTWRPGRRSSSSRSRA
jgi:2,5-diketo-D-gluconate reductase A